MATRGDARSIVGREEPAVQQRDAHRLEVASADDPPADRDVGAAVLEPAVAAAATDCPSPLSGRYEMAPIDTVPGSDSSLAVSCS